MKAVITGANGFVGRHIVNELIKRSVEVIAIDINTNYLPTEWIGKVEYLQMDIFNEYEYEKLVNYKADIFFHFAWVATSGNMRGDIDLQLNNVKYSCKLMEYEAMEYIIQDSSTPSPGMVYSTAKLTADFMLKILAGKSNIEYINALISNIYGAGENSLRFVNTILRKMIANEAIELTHCQQMYDFIYVTDAAKAIVEVGLNGRTMNTYYIGNKKQYPLKCFVEEMLKITGSKSELLYGKMPYNNTLLTYEEFDTSKVSNELNVTFEYTFKQGIETTIEWLKSNN